MSIPWNIYIWLNKYGKIYEVKRYFIMEKWKFHCSFQGILWAYIDTYHLLWQTKAPFIPVHIHTCRSQLIFRFTVYSRNVMKLNYFEVN